MSDFKPKNLKLSLFISVILSFFQVHSGGIYIIKMCTYTISTRSVEQFFSDYFNLAKKKVSRKTEKNAFKPGFGKGKMYDFPASLLFQDHTIVFRLPRNIHFASPILIPIRALRNSFVVKELRLSCRWIQRSLTFLG